jgi:opacity protein-like surface antigen
MKRLAKIGLGMLLAAGAFLAAPPAMGQGPIVSATGPEIEVHGGFEYIGQQIPATSRVPMYGVDSGMTVGVSRKLGVRLDVGYARGGEIFNSGHHTDILSYMAGPVFYPVRTRFVSPYVELLLGGARVTGATPDTQGGFVRGYANEFAWAGGGGLEIRTSPGFALRLGGDYFHTSYFDPNVVLTGQANLRAVASFTYYLGGRRR